MTSEEWNRMYPVGTLVRYFPMKGNIDDYEDLLTRSEAWELGDDTAVVSLQHKSGGFSLEHITPLDQPTVKTKPVKAYPVLTDRPMVRSNHSAGDVARMRCAAACNGNKWAEENCRAVGNWPV